MAKNNTPAEKPDNQELESQLGTDAQSVSVENPIPDGNPIPIEKTDASTEGNAPASTDARSGISSASLPTSDAPSDTADTKIEAQAKQLMLEHRVSAIWHSTDGNWFTDKNAAKAHDPESQCFTLENAEQ